MSHTLPTAIYASDGDFADYTVSSEQLSRRVDEVIGEIDAFFPRSRQALSAAE
jgi:FMN reductase